MNSVLFLSATFFQKLLRLSSKIYFVLKTTNRKCKKMFQYYKIVCVFFFTVIIKSVLSEDKNVTCSDNRICFIIETIEDHCEIYFGSECFPPCELKNCSIKIENNVLCEHYDCTAPIPKPSSTFWKDTILGAFGSFCSSCIFYVLWKIAKRLYLSRLNRIVPRRDDESGLLNENFQNIESDEGDSETRPIIRGASTSSLETTEQRDQQQDQQNEPAILDISATETTSTESHSPVAGPSKGPLSSTPIPTGSSDVIRRSQSVSNLSDLDFFPTRVTRSSYKKKFSPTLFQIKEIKEIRKR